MCGPDPRNGSKMPDGLQGTDRWVVGVDLTDRSKSFEVAVPAVYIIIAYWLLYFSHRDSNFGVGRTIV